MRVRVSPVMHPRYFFMPDALPAATRHISGLEDWLRICWLAYTEAMLTEHLKDENMENLKQQK